MDISAGERRQDFSEWLRTGRAVRNGVEFKFNPYHDPANGRFTTASGGWMGGGFTGGGGGSFGGGGASGSWSSTGKPAKAPGNASPLPRPVPPVSAVVAATPVIQQRLQLAPNPRRVVRNGYEYRIDAEDRTTGVSGTLTLSGTQLRSGRIQAQAGGPDRRPKTDDGGHYIAARFNGPTDAFNHFAQDANFNRGGYRVLENQWADETKSGKQVTVRITPSYDGASKRPAAIDVWYSIDGNEKKRHFPNERQEKRRGKH